MSGPGRVYLIGAGPGDPQLITMRGVQLIGQADVIVYDRNVEAALRWASPDAEKIAAGAPAETSTAQDALSMLLAEKAREGHVVARVKWGDPFVFDSGGKEAMFLHEQGVPFEVVPGVPLAIGATAYAGVPLSYPGAGDTIVLVRGYEDEHDSLPEADWNAIARLDGTFVCYAGGRQVPRVLSLLIEHGAAPETSAAVIYRGTQADQQTRTGTIGALAVTLESETSNPPAILVVGSVTRLRDHLRWFDERPLFGRRIVVTRSAEQAHGLTDALEALGAEILEAPTFRLSPPEDPEAVERATASIDQYGWVVFESANSVLRFLSALRRGPRDLRAFGQVAICAMGPSTADQLLQHGLKADVIVPEQASDPVGEALDAHAPLAGQRVLIVRPDHQRDTLADDLRHRGAAVTDLVAYRTASATAESPEVQDLYRRFLDGAVDAVTFTSATAVTRLAELLGEEQAADLLNTTVIAAIGPVTAAAARAHGIHTAIVADTYTVDGLVDAMVRHFNVK
ncbi:MAG TPA: uroporphyrinogen-III C-methyltransferase [Vicinamibacterales bacterium]|nr:uroporphyrinogen-III C-methyltransferase [Vicinamibacterales bacterium]